MTSIRAEIKPEWSAPGSHLRVAVYAGPDPEHRAHCGTLTMLESEAADLVARIDGGEHTTPMLDRLRAAVIDQGGDWDTQRAITLLGLQVTPERARQLLNTLAEEGLLNRQGARGYLWTVTEHAQITPQIAAHVLWHYGTGFGYRPDPFTQALLAAITEADAANRQRMAKAFPGYVAAIGLADSADSFARLRRIARRES